MPRLRGGCSLHRASGWGREDGAVVDVNDLDDAPDVGGESWWSTFAPRTRAQKIATGLVFGFLIGAVVIFAVGRVGRPPGPDSVDVGFLQDMIVHHQQALRLANTELVAGASPAVETFAREILRSQSYEIGLMTQKLHDWGYAQVGDGPAMEWMDAPVSMEEMPGLATEAEVRALERAAGETADSLFVRLMQDHHRGGVHMASYAADNAKTEFVRELAAGMARVQQIEIAELEGALEREGLDPTPPGFEPDEIKNATRGDHDGHGT